MTHCYYLLPWAIRVLPRGSVGRCLGSPCFFPCTSSGANFRKDILSEHIREAVTAHSSALPGGSRFLVEIKNTCRGFHMRHQNPPLKVNSESWWCVRFHMIRDHASVVSWRWKRPWGHLIQPFSDGRALPRCAVKHHTMMLTQNHRLGYTVLCTTLGGAVHALVLCALSLCGPIWHLWLISSYKSWEVCHVYVYAWVDDHLRLWLVSPNGVPMVKSKMLWNN